MLFVSLTLRFNYELDVDLADKIFPKYFREQNKLHPGFGFSKGISLNELKQKIGFYFYD
jgi:hypothetical protein